MPLIFTLFAFILTAHAQPTDSVRAVVANEIILESELAIESDLHSTDGANALVWQHNDNTPLDRLIMAAMIRTQAQTLAMYTPSTSTLDTRVGQLKDALGPVAFDSFLTEHGLTDPTDLNAILNKRVMVERFVNRNISVPTDQPEKWHHELELMLIGLRTNVRVRHISTAD